MFLLRKITIENHEKYIIEAKFIDDEEQGNEGVFSTLILGENGTGKSFLLKSIADIFIFLDKAQIYKRKPKFHYEKFSISYFYKGNEYVIDRKSGSEIICKKNGVGIDLYDVELPTNVLAVSFMVNDKFLFIDPNQKQSNSGMYRYLGVRKTTNATYTSSVISNVMQSVVQILCDGLFKEMYMVLKALHFDSYIEITFINNSKGKNTNVAFIKVDCFDCDINYFANYVINGEKLSNLIKHGIIRPSNISFYKTGEKIDFENCSSGEKHMIFAFSGILNAISENSLVLIDEPEISLHPEWQIQYISLLKKVFEKYKGCHFILASHSHYLVSDLQGDTSSIVTLSKENNIWPKAELLNFDTYAWSAENIIYNVFGLRTTRNYYFESDLRKLLSMIQAEDCTDIDIDKIIELTEKMKKYIYNEDDPLCAIVNQAEVFIKCIQKD